MPQHEPGSPGSVLSPRHRAWRRIRVWCLLGLGLSAWAGLPDKGVRLKKGDDLEAKLAEARLTGGRPQMAQEAAKVCLDKRPDALECLSVWARAASASGHCVGVEPAFQRLRVEGPWDAKTALAEGLCLMRLGDFGAAREAFEEASVLREDFAMARFQLGMVAVRDGELDLVRGVIDELLVLEETEWMVLVLEGWLAMEVGGEQVDAMLHDSLARTGEDGTRNALAQLAVMDCERWMALGDPLKAADVAKLGVKVTFHQVRLVACRAEALRRAGDPVEAFYLLDRPWNKGVAGMARESTLVRVLADLGRLDEAAAALAQIEDRLDPDVIAAEWYLSRRRGEVVRAAELARLYAGVVSAQGASLNAYLPFWED